MLAKIALENFRSFEQPVELTMVSSAKIRGHADHRIQIRNTRLLRHAVVYGANASGKTNLVEFFRFFATTLETGLPAWSARLFCNRPSMAKKKGSCRTEHVRQLPLP